MNSKLQQEVLKSITKALQTQEELFYTFVELERYIKSKVRDGEVCDYKLGAPYYFNLHVWMEQGKMNLSVKVKEQYISLRLHQSDKDLFELCNNVEQLIKEHKIPLVPKPNKEFVDYFVNAGIGDILNLNNTCSVVCTESSDYHKRFKRLFDGSLSNVTINSFKSSEEFLVNTSDVKDIWYLYNMAYDYRINAAPIRPYKDNGLYTCTDIELETPVNSSRKITIGPLTLIVTKNKTTDESKKTKEQYLWYDSAGNKIDRNLAGIIFGWAKNTIMKFDIKEWATTNPVEGFEWRQSSDTEYQSFYYKIRDYIITKNFSKMLEEIYHFSKETNNAKTLTFHALVDDNSHNFISTTYAFKSTDEKKEIFRLTYEDNDFTKDVIKVESISEEEFLTICQQFYDQNTNIVKNTYASIEYPDE